MKTLSISEAKMKLSSPIDALRETTEAVAITKNGAPAAVLVSPDEFECWQETMTLRFDPEFMAEVRNGLAAI